MKTANGMTMAALATALALAGCGGGSGESRDTRAPVVTISAATTTLEGGQSVVLSVAATDDVDGNLTPALSCSAGTLGGTTLTTPTVTAAQTVTCTASATDASGNKGQGSVSLQVNPVSATVAANANVGPLKPGSYGLLDTTGLALDQSTYAASLDGRAVTLHRSADASALAYAVPTDLPAGSYEIQFDVGTRHFVVPLTVDAGASVADPRAYVRDVLTRLQSDYDAFMATEGAALGAPQEFQNARQAVDEGLAKLDTLTDAEVSLLATTFAANGIGAAPAAAVIDGAREPRMRAASITDTCGFAKGYFLGSVGGTVAAIGVAKGLLAAPELSSKVGAAATIVGVLVSLNTLIPNSVEKVIANCVDTPAARLLAWLTTDSQLSTERMQAASARYQPAAADPVSLAFSNRVAQDFRVEVKTTLVQEVAGAVKAGAEQMLATLALVDWVPAPLTRLVTAATTGLVENLPASGVALSGTSDARVSGTAGGAGEKLTLQFTAAPEVSDETIPFTFTLTPAGYDAIPVTATLNLRLPQVQAGSVTVRQNRAVSSQLQVSNADTLQVTTQPLHGQVTLASDGSFTYTPSAGYFGTDEFSYRGVNADGVSDPEKVAVSVYREFAGTWNISSVSRTTSESSTGLCPDEQSEFSVNIAKISDTQYATNYGGFDIPLTMSSADDPAGLRGSKSVRYPDDPGQTSESLSVSIPDSDTLTGSTSWSYSGPNNSSCSGTTTITGTR